MNDFFSLSNEELHTRLIECINGQNEDALIYWGLVKFDNIDFKKYYLSIILIQQEKFDYAVQVARTIADKEVKRNSQYLILDAYAKEGNIVGFKEYFLNGYEGSIDRVRIGGYLYELLYHSDIRKCFCDGAMNEVVEEVLSSSKCIESSTISEGTSFLLKTIQTASLYIEAIQEAKDLIPENNEEANENAVLKILAYYNMMCLLFPEYANDIPIKDFDDDFDSSVRKFVNNTKESILSLDESDNKWLIYLTLLERVAPEDILIKEVSHNLSRFTSLIKTYGINGAFPLITACAKAINSKNPKATKMKAVLCKNGFEEDLKKATLYDSVMRNLSPKAQMAYKSARTLYKQIDAGEYDMKDAGPLALSFYRVIELESNESIWDRIVKCVSIETINNEYENIEENRRGRLKNIVPAFRNLAADNGKPGLMLGQLRDLMEVIRNPQNALAQRLRLEFEKILTDEGIKAFNEGLIDEWYSEINVRRFRNPPAHAKYLHFDVAKECKEYVEEQIVNLGIWFKHTR